MRMLLVRGEAVRTQPGLPPACKARGRPRAGARVGRAPDRTAAMREAQLSEKKGWSPVGPRPALNDNASHELQYQVDQQDYHEHSYD
jgi:hypothetical protein